VEIGKKRIYHPSSERWGKWELVSLDICIFYTAIHWFCSSNGSIKSSLKVVLLSGCRWTFPFASHSLH
jgi:hypothetical protein